uniref:Uroporphyrinogen decarboxylase n=1 Tax=Parasteatoda tepidariorum TaxID=114398 RepID=A0A2L2Y2V0_PARTP
MEDDKKFPPLQNDLILRAAWGQKTERVPVWIMRQAGRYLPEFQEVRKKHPFFEICQTPSLACEITLQPIKRFPLDAAIIFCDILVIPQALGMNVEMVPGIGPVISDPLHDPLDLHALCFPCEVEKELGYVFEAITLTRKELNGKVPLIGFSGAPWTLFCYMVEGQGSKTMSKAKGWLYKWPKGSHSILEMLTDVIVNYLIGQVKAGAQLLQVFESSAEHLGPEQFKTFALPYIKDIKKRVTEGIIQQGLNKVPMTLFAKGTCSVLPFLNDTGYEVISLDWTISPDVARSKISENITLQGNLDPCALKAEPSSIEDMVSKMIKGFGTQRYIANLGHGIYPEMDPDNVAVFIDSVHNISAAINSSKE